MTLVRRAISDAEQPRADERAVAWYRRARVGKLPYSIVGGVPLERPTARTLAPESDSELREAWGK